MATIENNSAQLYRITYEAYSKFANHLNRCSSITEVGEVSRMHLKYLLNFYVLRITIKQENSYLSYSLTGSDVNFQSLEVEELFPHEVSLLENGIPIRLEEMPKDIAEVIPNVELVNPYLWGWAMVKNDRDIIISLISDDNKPFSYGDVDILKLAADCFEAKFHELFLSRQLDKRNQSLTEALATIQNKNDEIQKIVENQQEIINERTSEIVEKNKKLLHISMLNAHNVREPLTRIQGLIQLFEYYDDSEIRTELIPKLQTSAEEMDVVLQEVIVMASRELAILKSDN